MLNNALRNSSESSKGTVPSIFVAHYDERLNMKLDKQFQRKLLMDVISQHFDEADDLVRFAQNRTGKLDGSVITSYWLGQEHMLRDKTSLAKYIKSECER